ncbi:MAG: hypothetical protein MRY76_02380 [Pseudomonadales bacterium]|nr:hypothetical protein [Pseudomonadales bacterium]
MKTLIALVCLLVSPVLAAEECVVLLHGLARVSDSMAELERKLERSGMRSVNISYPSRRHPIAELARDAVGRGLAACRETAEVGAIAADGETVAASRIHFVTHSLGGILLRVYLQEQAIPELGRVVMLGPPNQGSSLAQGLKGVPGFGFLGPAGQALGTDDESIINELGPVDFELGVIAGDLALNPLGLLLIDGPNDSVVSVQSTRVAGMKEHITLPVMHTLMMRDNEVIDHSIHFLKTGNFIPQ